MRLFATFLFASLAASASALPRMKVADILAKDADEISACGKCELEVQVAFVPPWVRNAFVATDVGDADGHALYFTTFTEPQPGKFDMVEPGDVVTVVGTPDPMLLEPGIDVESVKFVSHTDLPPPRARSVLGIKAGHFNNCRVHVRGVGVSAAYGSAAGKPAFLLWLSTSDGEIRVRVRDTGLSPAAFRDAEVEVDGVVVPIFNPRHEFIGAEIEALGAKSISVAKAPPEDPFSVPECDTWSLLAWSPRGRRLHACRVAGEVTCVYAEDGAFSVQRGKASARVFAEGELPAVGDMVEAAGFPANRDECGALVGALWRRTDADVDAAEVRSLSLAPGSLFDLGGFMADNDLQFRLVELRGRVTDVHSELHDTISQHISGAKLWVYSAKMAAGDTLAPGAAGALVMAENVLEATRREIRDAIMDLQSDEFVSQSTESLLRSICRDASVPGKTRVRSFLRGLPADLPIRVKRDLLAIASEAIGNAVRHGGAANVIVVSEGDGAGAFTIDVLNDGEPFSADAAPGPEKGHFGISNMRERAARSGMTLTFGEKRGYVAVTLTRRK